MAKDSSWAYLPDDLLLLVLRRLTSLADRVRAGAICSPWRSAAGQLPPRRLPWVMFGNGTLFDLANDSAPHPHHRLRLPDDCWRFSAGENMLFLVHQRDGSCSLLNALSGATTRLPELAGLLRTYNVRHRRMRNELSRIPHDLNEHRRIPQNELRRIFRSQQDQTEPPMKAIRKVVVSSSASDDEPIVVAVLIGRDVIVSTCRPAGESNSFLLGALHHEVIDIALFQGKIYALSMGHVLETIEPNNAHQGYELKYSTELIKHPWQQHHHQDVILDPLV
mgnify:CR=1 FL=1